MAEVTLNQQLNGVEIIEAVVDAIRQKMNTDCYLNRNSAYDFFSAKVSVELELHDTGTSLKSTFQADTTKGQPVDEVETVSASFEIEPAAPNEVRVASGQPVPTLTKDENGKSVVKGVRYSRKDAQKAMRA